MFLHVLEHFGTKKKVGCSKINHGGASNRSSLGNYRCCCGLDMWIERMWREGMTIRAYISEVERNRASGRSAFRWRDGVRRASTKREMGLEETRGMCI